MSRIVTIRKNRRVFADVSGSWRRPLDGYFALVRAQEWGVVDKLLFASDYPFTTPSDAVTGLRELTATKVAGLPTVRPDTLAHLLEEDPLPALGLSPR